MDSDIYKKLKTLKDKLVSQLVAGDIYDSFDGRIFNIGQETNKSLTLRLPTIKGVATATVKYDPDVCAGELYNLLETLGLKGSSSYSRIGGPFIGVLVTLDKV